MKISRIPQKQALETIQVANLSIPKHQKTKHEHLKEIENPDLVEKRKMNCLMKQCLTKKLKKHAH